MLWKGREQPRRAFRLLKAAEALERLPSLPGGAGFSADTLREAETKTIYYLAQVCASLGDGAASANYCAQTLERRKPTLALRARGWIDEVNVVRSYACAA